jgi:hypothetical protein
MVTGQPCRYCQSDISWSGMVHLARAYSNRCDLLEHLQGVLEKLSSGTGKPRRRREP